VLHREQFAIVGVDDRPAGFLQHQRATRVVPHAVRIDTHVDESVERAASLMLLNKCDLLPHLDFDVEAAVGYARRANPRIHVLRVSARTGEGMGEWLSWIEAGAAQVAGARTDSVAALRRRIAELEQRLASR
jgi:ribosome biogenesis GTPase A